MRRTVASLILAALACAPVLAGGKSLQKEIDLFFGTPQPLTLELRREHILQPDVAVVFFDLGERHLQMEIALPSDLVAQLPLEVVIDRSRFDYFVGRLGFAGELEVLDSRLLGRHLANPAIATLCGDRAVMTQGELYVPATNLSLNTTLGFGTASAEQAAAAKVGIFSPTCGLSVASCPAGTSCFWGRGSCGIGEDPFGGRWCACFM